LPDAPEVLALGVLARDAMLMHGLFLGMADAEAAVLFRDGMALAERLPDPTTARVRLLLRLGARKSLTGSPEEARPHIEEALALADRSGNALLQFLARFGLGPVLFNRGHPREALGRIAEAETLCGGDPEFATEFIAWSPYGMILNVRAACLLSMGSGEAGARELERAVEIARERKQHDLLVVLHTNALGWCDMARDAGGALAHARQAAESAEVGGTSVVRATAALALGQAHLVGAQWGDAVEALHAALTGFREGRTGLVLEARVLAYLAEAYLGAGDPDRACAAADEALAVARRRRTPLGEIAAHLARARVLLGVDGETHIDEVADALRDATALVETTEMRLFAPFLHVERARLMALTGDEAARQRALREAHRLFTQMGATARAEQVAKEFSP
jgi:tetratricopeptide (TPR) repeat protein